MHAGDTLLRMVAFSTAFAEAASARIEPVKTLVDCNVNVQLITWYDEQPVANLLNWSDTIVSSMSVFAYVPDSPGFVQKPCVANPTSETPAGTYTMTADELCK